MRAWENFLKHQDKELGVETVDKWLRSLRVLRFDACNLYLEAKDAFQVMWFEEHIRKCVDQELFNNNRKVIKVHLTTPSGGLGKREKPAKGKALKQPSNELIIDFDELDPLATFDNFVESESNILTHKLLTKITNYDPISQSVIPSTTELAAFNPIYLFGGEGSGKTHLLMATAHALKTRDLRVAYSKAETFTGHVVAAIRSGQMSIFRQAYRNIDVLLLDDVHIFSKKGATQEELFHTFNTLHLAGKQIILSANCSPAELQHIEPRLVSRFEWGIVLPIDSLEEKEVLAVLRKKAEALENPLPPKVEEFLISTFTNNPNSLIRALETLILRHHLRVEERKSHPSPLTVQIARHLLKDLIEEEEQQALTGERVIKCVAEYFGIKVEDILSKAQSRECVLPRQLGMYFCRTRIKLPYKRIGDLFVRDHSTVMSSVKLIEQAIERDDKEIMSPYICILKMLKR